MKETGIKIIKKLRLAGHEALFAGGCVRDMLMDNEPNDWDIATSARPKEVEKLFDKVIYVGKSKACGTSYVIENNSRFEVTTFRTDFDYDGRHPGRVKFVSMEEDALRRDFTINGMFYDPINDRIIDFVGGQRDIEEKVVRFIGNAEDRIEEDNLRIIRALRFADRLNFSIENDSYRAIKRDSYKIQTVSRERIRDEIVKTFERGNGIWFLKYGLNSHILNYLIPEIGMLQDCKQNPRYHPEGNVYIHTENVLKILENENYLLKLAGLFHDIAKPQTFGWSDGNEVTSHGHAEIGAEMTELILKRLAFSNDEIDQVCSLVRDHMKPKEIRKMRKSTFRKLAGQPYFDDLMKLHRADCLASNGDLSDYESAMERLKEFEKERLLPKPLIDGRDLIAIGFAEGPEIGEVKRMIYDSQLEGQIDSFEDALTVAKHIYRERSGILV